MCHVTKYSTSFGVFQQPWPGVFSARRFERGEGPGDEVGPEHNFITSAINHFFGSHARSRSVRPVCFKLAHQMQKSLDRFFRKRPPPKYNFFSKYNGEETEDGKKKKNKYGRLQKAI